MVDCARFLEEYSDFRDCLLAPEQRREFEAHLAACSSCARYDRVVDRGASIFRELPEVEPSEDFAARLQHRIFHVEDEMRAPGRSFSGISAPTAFSIAAVLAAAAWLPVLRSPADSAYRLPAVSAHAPQPEIPVLSVAGPLLAHTAVLHEGLEPADLHARDSHLLFRYYPLGVPVSNPVAFNTLSAD